jgi:predicted MFS family arabinose efflux permease
VAAAGSACSLAARVALGARADRRRDYGYRTVVLLLVAGALGFALMTAGTAAPFVIGSMVAFALGWGWPGLFNLAVVEHHRDAPAAATGVTQTGIYVGAAGGPLAFGLLSGPLGYDGAWAAVAGISLAGALVMAAAGRADVAAVRSSTPVGRP